MSDSQELIILIDQRLEQARAEIASLEAALAAVAAPDGDGATNGSASPTRRRAAASRARTGTAEATKRRTPRKAAKPVQVVPAGKIEALLTGTQGLTTSALADLAGGDRRQVLTLLREMEAAGQVRRSGERRATRWHAITDEDRVAARVAELERQRKQPA